ncbi:MAG TPA: F420-0:Gamma-glutamyl ligase [Acidaminococcaceae bacterium]|nr:F420-0:Gamma-glutamyl ligase [Acidaminococcaceae bacterium]
MSYEIVPIPTRILTSRDNIVDAIKEYGKGKFGPNDVICSAESVVAITQGMTKRCEEFKPGWLAKILCHFFPSYGSISGWYCMQALIDTESSARVLGAFLVGAITKVLGRRGVFYQLAGYQARLIDDVTGTMPPYDKHIVYGPVKPFEVVSAIKKECGVYGAVIADVNDLKRAAIIGWTEGVDPAKVSQILIDNPFGNASQKTPICIIKNYNKD